MWCIDESTARWSSSRFDACVSLALPCEGIQQMRVSGRELGRSQLLRVALASPDLERTACIKDPYVRGADLHITYAEDRSVRPHITWRIVDDPAASPTIGVEAIVSIQTLQLDSDPRIEISSAMAECDWFVLRGNSAGTPLEPIGTEDPSPHMLEVGSAGMAILARRPGAAFCVGHALVANDLLRAEIAWDRAHRLGTLSAAYFRGRLEKGVLRRVRMRAFIVPREGDAELLRHLLDATVVAAPPLST